jgi:hypothetical protein
MHLHSSLEKTPKKEGNAISVQVVHATLALYGFLQNIANESGTISKAKDYPEAVCQQCQRVASHAYAYIKYKLR